MSNCWMITKRCLIVKYENSHFVCKSRNLSPGLNMVIPVMEFHVQEYKTKLTFPYCFKVFFDIIWNGMMASLQNLGQLKKINFLKHDSYEKYKVVFLEEKKLASILYLRHVFYWNISKSDVESQNLAFSKTMSSFYFKRYWSFLWTHSSLG